MSPSGETWTDADGETWVNMRNYWKVNGELTLPWGEYADKITAVVVERGVTAIGQMAFYGLENLETVILADSVIEIRNYAFKNCTSLSAIDVGEGMLAIREGAFYNCTELTEIALPAGCSVGEWAYGGTCPID